MEDIRGEIKKLIVETLNLKEVRAEEIDDDGPLFGAGLGLDSLDALELVVALQRRYGVKIETNAEEAPRIFASVRTIAEHIRARRAAT